MLDKKKIFIYDSTLRDGAQTKGVDFSLSDKVAIAKELDNFGLDFFKEFIGKVNKHLNLNNLFEDGDFIKSSRKSLFIIDGIISDFFLVND